MKHTIILALALACTGAMAQSAGSEGNAGEAEARAYYLSHADQFVLHPIKDTKSPAEPYVPNHNRVVANSEDISGEAEARAYYLAHTDEFTYK